MLLACIQQVRWGAQSKGASEGGGVRTHRDVQGRSQVSSPGGQPRLLPHLSPATPHAPPQGTPLHLPVLQRSSACVLCAYALLEMCYNECAHQHANL